MFIQIISGSIPHGGDTIIALDDEGFVWMLMETGKWKCIGPPVEITNVVDLLHIIDALAPDEG